MRCKPGAAKLYRSVVERFILPAYGHLAVEEVDREHIADLHYELRDMPYQAKLSLMASAGLPKGSSSCLRCGGRCRRRAADHSGRRARTRKSEHHRCTTRPRPPGEWSAEPSTGEHPGSFVLVQHCDTLHSTYAIRQVGDGMERRDAERNCRPGASRAPRRHAGEIHANLPVDSRGRPRTHGCTARQALDRPTLGNAHERPGWNIARALCPGRRQAGRGRAGLRQEDVEDTPQRD